MQPKSVSTFAFVESSDWAFWLNSVALNPDSHAALIEVEDQIQFLDKQEQKDLHEQGTSFQNLTIDKIIEITEKLWKDPTVKQTEKVQMLNGMRYIHQRRQAKYERLFWLVKIFAKIRGIESGLRREKETINKLDAELNSTLSDHLLPNSPNPVKPILHGKIPVITKPVVLFDKKVKEQLEKIKKEVNELIEQTDLLEEYERQDWCEKFFALEKRLYNITLKLSKDLICKMKDHLDELNKTFADANPFAPRVKDIAQLFGHHFLKPNLNETLSAICLDKGIADDELDRDQNLFECSRFEVKALYVKRLIKANRTDLSLSLITAIERTWKEIEENDQGGETRIFDLDKNRWRVIFLPEDKEVYLKEGYLSEGSYKAAFEITSFHNLDTKQQRSELVILQSLPAVFSEIEEYKEQRSEQSLSLESQESSQSFDSLTSLSEQRSPKDDGSKSFMVKSSKSVEISKDLSKKQDQESRTLSANQSQKIAILKRSNQSENDHDLLDSQASDSQSDNYSSIMINSFSGKSDHSKKGSAKSKESSEWVISKSVETEKKCASQSKKQGLSDKVSKTTSTVDKLAKSKVSKSSSESLEEDECYQKEAENCLLYGKLPGIWPTFKVTTVDKRVAIIQPKASYLLKTLNGETVKALNLQDMCILLERKLLNKKDQLAFIKMLKHTLIGVESLHKLDIIHRDLKPQNILCGSDGTAGVSDLGTICPSTIESPLGSGNRKPNLEKMNVVGTPIYISPEIALCYVGYTMFWNKINISVDIWSLGLILWEAFSGESLNNHPVNLSLGIVDETSPIKTVNLISGILSNTKKRSDIYKKLYLEPKEKSSLAHLIWSCTRPEPIQRPSIAEIIVCYEAWAKYTEDKMKAGKVQSICETFHDAVV